MSKSLSAKPQQLTLPVQLADDSEIGSYFSKGNELALGLVEQLAAAETPANGERHLFLAGALGSGKSHLLQACYRQALSNGLQAYYLNFDVLADYPVDAVEGLGEADLLCLDDIQLIAELPHWQQALFHLFNQVRDAGGRCLMAATQAPALLPLTLEDLRSRLAWGPVIELQPLDDKDKVAALMLRARRRGLTLGEGVAEYLLRRQARDWPSLMALLTKLDDESLAAGKRLTLPFVRSVLA